MAYTGPGRNHSSRVALHTANEKSIVIVHRAEMSPKWLTYMKICGIISPLSCLCCFAQKIYDNTYLEVHENRVEYNYPNFDCCSHMTCGRCCKVTDDVKVHYFDRKIVQHAGRAGVCTPAFTHCQLWPTCCDITGQGVVLYGARCCMCEPCCRRWVLLPGLDDADAFVAAFNAAKAQGAAAAGPPAATGPTVVYMTTAAPMPVARPAPAPVEMNTYS